MSKLHDAVYERNMKEVYDLIDKGCNINAAASKGETALHIICETDKCNEESEFISLLIKNGANVNAKDIYGHTPLHHLASRTVYSVDLTKAQILIDNGADINAKDNLGRMPFQLCFDRIEEPNRKKLFELLLPESVKIYRSLIHKKMFMMP